MKLSNEQILKKAIEKAVKNGFDIKSIGFEPKYVPEALIFNHDFAKAFWDEPKNTVKKVLVKKKIISRVTRNGVQNVFQR